MSTHTPAPHLPCSVCHDLNVPAAHAVHGPPLGPLYPGMHVQFLTSVEFSPECEFWGQEYSAPSTQYFPGAHGLHPANPLPCVPFRQRQKSASGDCGGLSCSG